MKKNYNIYKDNKKQVKEMLAIHNLKAFKIGGKYKITGQSEVLKEYVIKSNYQELIIFIENNITKLEAMSKYLNDDQKIWDFLEWAKNKIDITININEQFFQVNNTYFQIKSNYINNDRFYDYGSVYIDKDLFLYIKNCFSFNHVDYLIAHNQLENKDVKELHNLINLYKLNQKLTDKLIEKNTKTKINKI